MRRCRCPFARLFGAFLVALFIEAVADPFPAAILVAASSAAVVVASAVPVPLSRRLAGLMPMSGRVSGLRPARGACGDGVRSRPAACWARRRLRRPRPSAACLRAYDRRERVRRSVVHEVAVAALDGVRLGRHAAHGRNPRPRRVIAPALRCSRRRRRVVLLDRGADACNRTCVRMTACGGTSSRWASTASAQHRRFPGSTGSCAPCALPSSRARCSTRSRRGRRSTGCPGRRRCRSAGRSTRTAAVRTPASTASRAPPACCSPTARTRPIAELRVGDVVLGTEQVDGGRRYVPTRCSRTGPPRKPALRRAPRGRHRAGHERRAPLPHRARLAPRQRGLVPRRAAPPPAARVAVARPRTVRPGGPARAPAPHPPGTGAATCAVSCAATAPRGFPSERARRSKRSAGPTTCWPTHVRTDRRGGPARPHRARRTAPPGTARAGRRGRAAARMHARAERSRCRARPGHRRTWCAGPSTRTPTGVRGSSPGVVDACGVVAPASCGSCAPTRPSSGGSRARCTGWVSRSPSAQADGARCGAAARRASAALRALLARTGPAVTRRLAGAPGRRRARAGGRGGAGARRRAADVRHHHRHRRLRGRRRDQPQLLRAQHPHLPRHGRGRRLRPPDRRQGQRGAGAAARAAVAALVRRAGRDGHQHRPLPARGGSLPADARRSSTRSRARAPRSRC